MLKGIHTIYSMSTRGEKRQDSFSTPRCVYGMKHIDVTLLKETVQAIQRQQLVLEIETFYWSCKPTSFFTSKSYGYCVLIVRCGWLSRIRYDKSKAGIDCRGTCILTFHGRHTCKNGVTSHFRHLLSSFHLKNKNCWSFDGKSYPFNNVVTSYSF